MDRNVDTALYDVQSGKSLSARRAWIEIYTPDEEFEIDEVALRKESVDRNIWPVAYDATNHGRSPQGERG